MQDIGKIIRTMPKIKSTIQVHGQAVVVTGYRITADAAYVVYNNGVSDQMIHKSNLARCANGKEW